MKILFVSEFFPLDEKLKFTGGVESYNYYLVKELSKDNELFVLEEKGVDISETKISDNCAFIIGDQVGLPKKEEGFVLRYGKKISLGKRVYLAADCITILNYNLDKLNL